MTAIDIFRRLKEWGPVLFALGFVAPLIAQSLDRANIAEASAFTHLQLAFAIALPLGWLAKARGRWV